MKRIITLVLIMTLVLSVNGLVLGQELSGDDILDKVEASIDAQSSKVKLRMELYDKSGSKRKRKLEAFTKDGEYDKALIRFLAPASVEDTAFLSQEKNSDDEDMYLYMPALGNVRKIAGSQKNGSFVGTDFSYNDLSILGGGNYKEDYKATILKENNKEYLLRLVPTDEEIEYKFVKMWVQKSNWFPTKLKFYDEEGKLYKELISEDIKEKSGYWTAEKMTMKDLQADSKTILYLDEITYDLDLNDRIFTVRYLRR
ncbi:outer membrane lipoprotein-sorting protein [Sporohalobacter salinus]|uniref:outer membrane lipoprotein-sorting protein n=1 Tax=Sporohalobacter salinus TaxID=1494606 RepID=UPI0019620453|nr:outer membrane lipoprotein-sorting protein [Sporohalobacter salinus]MBM7623569.1 outer membrane lipoprotein-sorting protein [Sporohalobacter salinus]